MGLETQTRLEPLSSWWPFCRFSWALRFAEVLTVVVDCGSIRGEGGKEGGGLVVPALCSLVVYIVVSKKT